MIKSCPHVVDTDTDAADCTLTGPAVVWRQVADTRPSPDACPTRHGRTLRGDSAAELADEAGQVEEVCSDRKIPMRTMSSYPPRTHACWRCSPSITKPAFSYARIAATFDEIACR